MALDIVLLKDPRGALFLMCKIPLWSATGSSWRGAHIFSKTSLATLQPRSQEQWVNLQGYLTYKKTPAPRTIQELYA